MLRYVHAGFSIRAGTRWNVAVSNALPINIFENKIKQNAASPKTLLSQQFYFQIFSCIVWKIVSV